VQAEAEDADDTPDDTVPGAPVKQGPAERKLPELPRIPKQISAVARDMFGEDDDDSDTDGDEAQVESDLAVEAKTVSLAVKVDPVVAPAAPSKPEAPRKAELSLASQSEALDDLAGAIPNVEKEALELYNTFGGEPSSLESISLAQQPGFAAPSAMFLQVHEQKKHTPGVPSQANMDAAWDLLTRVAKQKHEAMSLAQHLESRSGKPVGVLLQRLQENLLDDIDDECDWLMSNFYHRQQDRAQEEAALAEAHRLLGGAHVFAQEPRRLRGHW
jgi:hypothetical protein